MPQFQYSVNDEKTSVEFAYDRNSGTLVVGDRSYSCDGRSVIVDGRRIPFWVNRSQDSVQVWLDGTVHSFAVEDPRRRSSGGSSSGGGGGRVKAQMPGKILQVTVKPGDIVAVGANLLIMESMKMELALDASVAGTVVSVKVEPNQMVSQGELLVEIEVPNESQDQGD